MTKRKLRSKQQVPERDANLVTNSYHNNNVQINSNLVLEAIC